jgi:polar amino acid transport system substrate-binding protein
MLKKLSLVALLLAAFGAQAVELPESIQSSKTITVGVVPNYPPLEMKDLKTGELTGFDIELGNAIGKKLGVEIKWQETSFEQFLSSIKTNRLDMILSGFSDLPARQDTATFVDYVRSGIQFFTQASRAAEFKTVASLCGKNVGASRRTSLPGEIKNWSDANCVAKSQAPITVTGTEGSADARTQLRQGRIDAAVQGSETLPYIMSQDPNTFALVGEPIRYTLMGIAMAKDQPLLHKAVVGALDELVKDGTYKRLLDKYQLSTNGVSSFTINAGK